MPPDTAEPVLFSRRDMGAIDLCAVGPGEVAAFTTRSPIKNTDNEDAAAIIPIDDARAVLVVADGLGGHAAGAEASALAVRTLAETIVHGLDEEDSLRAVILDGIESANRRVTALGIGAATTIAIVEVNGHVIRPYHVGDSSILVIGQRGRIRHETVAHSPVAYLVEAGVLDREQAIHHEDRHVVSNIVGSPDMRIEIGPEIALHARDTIVLGSDGLFDNLFVEEIVERVRKGPLATAAETLRQDVGRRMGRPEEGRPSKPDDLTLLVFRLRRTRKNGT